MSTAENYAKLFPLRQEQVQEALRAMDANDKQPCIRCPFSAACADLHMACKPYHRWMQGRLPLGIRKPTRAIYEESFREDDC